MLSAQHSKAEIKPSKVKNSLIYGKEDAIFLEWLHARLINVHGEHVNVDYLHRLRSIIAKMKGGD